MRVPELSELPRGFRRKEGEAERLREIAFVVLGLQREMVRRGEKRGKGKRREAEEGEWVRLELDLLG